MAERNGQTSVSTVVVVILLAGLAWWTYSSRTYDLECNTKLNDVEALSFRYRIDLWSKRWCVDKCEDVESIKSVTQDTITLHDDNILKVTIGRSSGRIAYVTGGQTLTGMCYKKRFSGFPKKKF